MAFYILIILGFLSSIDPFATDIYLASFPEMALDLNTSQSGAQLTLSTFLIGAGLGHIVFGPLSDKIGRRKPLIIGLIVFAITSVLCPFAPSIEVLILLRLLQGFSGASALVIPRAIVMDLCKGAKAAKALNIITAVISIAPVLAPIAGSLFAGALGWRGLLGIVAVLAVLCPICVFVFIKESKDISKKPDNIFISFKKICRFNYFGYIFAFGFAMAALMSYVSASPFLFQSLLGLSVLNYGLVYGINAVGLLIFSAIGIKLVGKFSPYILALISLIVCIISGVCLIPFAASESLSFYIDIFLFFAVAPVGIIFGNTTSLALASVEKSSLGFASAVLGLLQFVFAGLVAYLVGIAGENTFMPCALIISISFILSFASLIFAKQNSNKSIKKTIIN